ncbi:hypothetical protein [Deinococcus misasensis]|uniref:hypothetical protein n=1 Tax=Deinococcus misasensis TaxID=392413 RepID=UPI0005503501|nr:hypothetical protein [Deinococcus misasensis]
MKNYKFKGDTTGSIPGVGYVEPGFVIKPVNETHQQAIEADGRFSPTTESPSETPGQRRSRERNEARAKAEKAEKAPKGKAEKATQEGDKA